MAQLTAMMPKPLQINGPTPPADGFPWVVECEVCQQEYLYYLRQGDQVIALDPRAGRQEGVAVRPIAPCPRCGWIQEPMIASYKAHHTPALFKVGGVVIIVAVVLFVLVAVVPSDVPRIRDMRWLIAPGATLAVGLVLGALGLIWRACSNPNARSREKRLALAERVSLPRSAAAKRGGVPTTAFQASGPTGRPALVDSPDDGRALPSAETPMPLIANAKGRPGWYGLAMMSIGLLLSGGAFAVWLFVLHKACFAFMVLGAACVIEGFWRWLRLFAD
jgi:hypothetical protein